MRIGNRGNENVPGFNSYRRSKSNKEEGEKGEEKSREGRHDHSGREIAYENRKGGMGMGGRTKVVR